MAVYPGSLDTFSTKVDKVDLYLAAHMNDVQAAIVAVETELGTDPAGSETDLKTRLAAGLNADGTLKTGFSVASATITTLIATTVGCQVIGNHNIADPTSLQRVAADAAATGGDARGMYAVDLQSSRNLATQVASGMFSTLTGGAENTASGVMATVAGGTGNTASATGATVIGGGSNVASGNYSIASGQDAKADKDAQHAQASGKFAATGDAQTSVLTLRKQTTDAAQTALALDGSAALIGLEEDATYFFEAHVVARRTDADNESAAYVIRWCCDRNTAGGAALVGAIDYDLTIEDTVAWACVVDVNGNDTRILVTGEAGKTIRWLARVMMTEVHG